MRIDQVEQIMNSQDGGESVTYGTGGHLARLLYRFYRNSAIDAAMWNRMLHAFIQRHNQAIATAGTEVKKKTLSAGNLRGLIMKGNISWINFWRAIMMTNPIKIEFGIRATYQSGRVISASLEVNSGELTLDTSEGKEDDQA